MLKVAFAHWADDSALTDLNAAVNAGLVLVGKSASYKYENLRDSFGNLIGSEVSFQDNILSADLDIIAGSIKKYESVNKVVKLPLSLLEDFEGGADGVDILDFFNSNGEVDLLGNTTFKTSISAPIADTKSGLFSAPTDEGVNATLNYSPLNTLLASQVKGWSLSFKLKSLNLDSVSVFGPALDSLGNISFGEVIQGNLGNWFVLDETGTPTDTGVATTDVLTFESEMSWDNKFSVNCGAVSFTRQTVGGYDFTLPLLGVSALPVAASAPQLWLDGLTLNAFAVRF